MRSLEDLARQLEREDLDPEEAWEVYRRAMEEHAELEKILSRVEAKVQALEADRTEAARPD